MKLLAVSDRVVNHIYSDQIHDHYSDVDLVVGCGDLPYYYLEYIVTVLKAPLIYVYGNHDGVQHTSDGRSLNRAEGCVLIEGQTWEYQGLLFAGLGGSMRYQPGAENQYSEAEMRSRVAMLTPALMLNKVRYGRYLDVLVTHSPPFGVHDGTDLTHTGFKALLTFLEYFKPRYLLHGHMHRYRQDARFRSRVGDTIVINVYPNRVIDLDHEEPLD